MKNKWRLPTKEELTNILETSREEYLDGHLPDVYWSSTCMPKSAFEWVVSFGKGRSCWHNKDNNGRIRCVRLIDGVLKFHDDTKYLNWNKAVRYIKKLNEQIESINVVVLDDTGSLSIQTVECLKGKSIEKQINEQVNTAQWFY